jgi:DNA-binding protein Fis
MNLQQQENFYQVMTRLKTNSRAASSTQLPEAEIRVTEMDSNGMLGSKPVKKVTNIGDVKEQEKEPIVIDLQKSKAGSDVTKYYYDMSLPSTGDQVYKCGLHEFETNNLTEFNRHVENHGSRAASVRGINKIKEIHDFIMANGRI